MEVMLALWALGIVCAFCFVIWYRYDAEAERKEAADEVAKLWREKQRLEDEITETMVLLAELKEARRRLRKESDEKLHRM